MKDSSDNQETLQNLKDFLQYLEDKNIINSKQLENKEEMSNLISDLMKLDLNKFSSKGVNASNNGLPPQHQSTSITCKNSPVNYNSHN